MYRDVQNLISSKASLENPRVIPIGGGSINQTFRIEKDSKRWFCKINSANQFPLMFAKERNGLEFLRATITIKVPEVVWWGEENGKQILLLEWIEQGMRTENFWKKFGEQLAKLHQSETSSDRSLTAFGFHEDNYMGALPQENSFKENWIEFFVHCRLQPQLELAMRNSLIGKEIDQFHSLYKELKNIFSIEPPAALHGDLWNGNYLCGEGGTPVLIDPAVYYGHRCVDLGMTRLFGGFDNTFYQAYHYHYPLPKNFEEQTDVCNLYPLLIHLNLFGSGYLSSIKSILKSYT